jgi:hypothetical protein
MDRVQQFAWPKRFQQVVESKEIRPPGLQSAPSDNQRFDARGACRVSDCDSSPVGKFSISNDKIIRAAIKVSTRLERRDPPTSPKAEIR